MLFSNVFVYTESRSANQNLRRSISPSAAALCSLHLCDGDEKSVNATLLIPVIYKCPLPQPLSFDILTNAPGVWGSTFPFLKSYLNSFCSQRAFSCKRCICKSPVFFTLRTLPSSVSCNSCICHSYENCRCIPTIPILVHPEQLLRRETASLLCAPSAPSASLR